MSRVFNVTVFSGTIGKSSNYYSDASYNELIGQADTLIVEIACDSVPGNETVYLGYQTSNDNINWQSTNFNPTLVAVAANPFPQTTIATSADASTGTNLVGAYGRFKITVLSNTSGDAIRLIVCGRTS